MGSEANRIRISATGPEHWCAACDNWVSVSGMLLTPRYAITIAHKTGKGIPCPGSGAVVEVL